MCSFQALYYPGRIYRGPDLSVFSPRPVTLLPKPPKHNMHNFQKPNQIFPDSCYNNSIIMIILTRDEFRTKSWIAITICNRSTETKTLFYYHIQKLLLGHNQCHKDTGTNMSIGTQQVLYWQFKKPNHRDTIGSVLTQEFKETLLVDFLGLEYNAAANTQGAMVQLYVTYCTRICINFQYVMHSMMCWA